MVVAVRGDGIGLQPASGITATMQQHNEWTVVHQVLVTGPAGSPGQKQLSLEVRAQWCLQCWKRPARPILVKETCKAISVDHLGGNQHRGDQLMTPRKVLASRLCWRRYYPGVGHCLGLCPSLHQGGDALYCSRICVQEPCKCHGHVPYQVLVTKHFTKYLWPV